MSASPTTVDSPDHSVVSDTDPDRPDDESVKDVVQPAPRVIVSDPSVVSSRSSTPLDGFVAPMMQLAAPLADMDDECVSLLSSDDEYESSVEDQDLEYVSAMEAPETQADDGNVQASGRESSESFYAQDDPDDVFSSTTCDNDLHANYDNNDNDDNDADDDDEDDDDDDDDSVHVISALTGGGDPQLQESSNSASTLLEDPDEAPQLSRDIDPEQSSSDDDNDDDADADDDDDDDDDNEITLLDVASDGEDNSSCLAQGNNPMTEPLLAPDTGDSDQSDPNWRVRRNRLTKPVFYSLTLCT